jgi:hypothetical protein
LQVAVDVGYLSEAEGGELLDAAREVSRMIAGLMAYLRRSGLDGPKYRAPDSELQADVPEADELET